MKSREAGVCNSSWEGCAVGCAGRRAKPDGLPAQRSATIGRPDRRGERSVDAGRVRRLLRQIGEVPFRGVLNEWIPRTRMSGLASALSRAQARWRPIRWCRGRSRRWPPSSTGIWAITLRHCSYPGHDHGEYGPGQLAAEAFPLRQPAPGVCLVMGSNQQPAKLPGRAPLWPDVGAYPD